MQALNAHVSTAHGYVCIYFFFVCVGPDSLPDVLGPRSDILSPLLRICCSTSLPNEGQLPAPTPTQPQVHAPDSTNTQQPQQHTPHATNASAPTPPTSTPATVGAMATAGPPATAVGDTTSRVVAKAVTTAIDDDETMDSDAVVWCGRLVGQILLGAMHPAGAASTGQADGPAWQLLCPLVLARRRQGEQPAPRPALRDAVTHAVSAAWIRLESCSNQQQTGASIQRLRHRRGAIDYAVTQRRGNSRLGSGHVSPGKAGQGRGQSGFAHSRGVQGDGAATTAPRLFGFAAWAQQPGQLGPQLAANVLMRLLSSLWRRIRCVTHTHTHTLRTTMHAALAELPRLTLYAPWVCGCSKLIVASVRVVWCLVPPQAARALCS